jgi:hypothetical protein
MEEWGGWIDKRVDGCARSMALEKEEKETNKRERGRKS